jgi:hypothetical protein
MDVGVDVGEQPSKWRGASNSLSGGLREWRLRPDCQPDARSLCGVWRISSAEISSRGCGLGAGRSERARDWRWAIRSACGCALGARPLCRRAAPEPYPQMQRVVSCEHMYDISDMSRTHMGSDMRL